MNKRNQRGFSVLDIVLGLALVAVIGAAGITAYQSQQTKAKTTSVAGATYFEVKEFGVKFVLPSDLQDLTYTYNDGAVAFSTKSLEARADFSCKDAGPAGNFFKGNDATVGPDQPIQEGNNVKVLDGVYYDVEETPAVCFTDKESIALQDKAIQSLARAITSSLVAD